jgi:uncharacterized protein (DUF302 family)
LGATIPGNQVIMVFHLKSAIQMLETSVAAGIEAPLRYYITEDADGTATLTYRTPSSTFAPYDNTNFNEIAGELDVIFANTAQRSRGE